MTKYIICLGDGMSDLPLDQLKGKTPLQVASTPGMDFMAQNGLAGRVQTVPEGCPPGSDVANMAVLGYDPKKYHTGRGPIEAASLRIQVPDGMIAFRCNLVYINDDMMIDFSAGHITSEESAEIFQDLNNAFKDRSDIQFYSGVSYRNILLLSEKYLDLKTVPPHDITDQDVLAYLPSGSFEKEVQEIMADCHRILMTTSVNKKRILKGQYPASHIWPWSQGKNKQWPLFKDKYGIEGGIVTAVDLLKGIGVLSGLETPNVVGATGFIDTDYQAKMAAAFKILKEKDFVYIHIEAPDEAGHQGDYQLKIRAIEDFDHNVVQKALAYQKQNPDTRIMVLCDHPTPCALKTHTSDPVPFAMYDCQMTDGSGANYDEALLKEGFVSFNSAVDLLDQFIG